MRAERTIQVWREGEKWIVSSRSHQDLAPDTESTHWDQADARAAAHVLAAKMGWMIDEDCWEE
jgi:hypothetical protein